jgi:two-component system, sensor histidine kinase SagS
VDEARPRLLLIGPSPGPLDGAVSAADIVPVAADPAEVARQLREGRFNAVLACPEVVAGLLDRFRRDELIVGHIDKGLAVLDPAGIVIWANIAFRKCAHASEDPTGKPFLAILDGSRIASVERVEGKPDHAVSPQSADPLEPVRQGRPTSLRLHCPNNPDQPFVEVDLRPVFGHDRTVNRIIALVRDISPEVVQQQKLDALHAAGRELAGLDPDLLSEMNTSSRAELLRQNLRRSIHDLLHYDTIEVRVLDRRTGELKPLLADGMTEEAAGRVLHARPTENGATGYTAYTGESYLCADAASDPHYIQGAAGARSSMTVPLKYQDEVIGTLNVESPRVNAFGPDDLQFTELFSKEVASALRTLDLLSAQQECTASQSIEAVNREIALPIDEVLASASLLIGKISVDPETCALLRKILDNARQVKECVSRVGRTLTPAAPASPDGTRPAGSRGSGVHPVLVPNDLPTRGPSAVVEGETPLAGRRVLVVDADEYVRRQAHLLLTRLGATTETASTAMAGLAMATDNRYSAILLDVRPSDMGGYECYRRFRAAAPLSTIALTTGFGYDLAHSIVKARHDGLRYVLFKPFREEQVVAAVLDAATPRG